MTENLIALDANKAEIDTTGYTPKQIQAIVELQLRQQCEDDFYTFVQQAWPIIEGGKKFVKSWSVQCMCEHLEEVFYGRILRLLVNIPPRMTKSSCIAVLFPVWVWIKASQTQMLTVSYLERLARRDNVKARRLMKSKWFRQRWPDARIQLAEDQDTKDRVDNMQGGYRVIAGLDSGITGDGGDIIICFPYDEIVWTERGALKIGDIVEKRLNVRVWSADTKTGKYSLKPIVDWYKNPGSEIIEVELSDGSSLRCTPEHKIWTSGRGFVPAVSLKPSDVIPLISVFDSINYAFAHFKFLCQIACSSLGFKYFKRSLFSNFCESMFRSAGQIVFLGYITCIFRPTLPTSYTVNGSDFNSIFFSEVRRPLITQNDFPRNFRRQSGAPPTGWVNSVSFTVRNIFGSSSVAKILQKIIFLVSVKVSNIHFIWSRPNETQHYRDVHREAFLRSIETRPEHIISVSVLSQFKNRLLSLLVTVSASAESWLRACSAEIRYAIKILKSDQRFPNFIREAGHADSTYCLTVEDNHNFLCGVGQVLVSNCDDPNNVRDQSDTALDNALSVYQDVLPTRFNDFKTGRMVVVQQRTSMKDISGYIIANQKDEFTHLCLPMEFEPSRKCVTVPLKSTNGLPWEDPRTEAGELLAPDRIGPKELAGLKKALGSEYAISGQLQQRPAPTEGGLIKRAWFQPWRFEEPPNIKYIIQAWDTATSEKKHAAYSAMLTCGVFEDDHGIPCVMLLSCWRKKVAFPELYKTVQRLGRDYRATKPENKINEKYKPDIILVEDKSSGVQLIQTLNKTGLMLTPWNPDKYGDKTMRVIRTTHILESGRFYVPYRAPDFRMPKMYADFLISQCAVWPKGESRDLIDCMTTILQRIINSGWVLHPLEQDAKSVADWEREHVGNEQGALY